jgi:MoaA/NifB/PqqE/SkfB family radical SAM enzyme
MKLPIKKAVIEICGSCNYKCVFCPHSIGDGREKQFKRLMNYQMFINILDQLKDSEVEEIYLEGSGEPTMNKKLPDFVKAGTDRGFKMSFITNGFWFKDDLMKATIDAGMHFARISVTGYNQELYKEQMSKDAFYEVMENANAAIEYGGAGKIGSYHLILDNSKEEYEVDQYRKNWIDHVPGVI